jgi:cell division septation protein DedD
MKRLRRRVAVLLGAAAAVVPLTLQAQESAAARAAVQLAAEGRSDSAWVLLNREMARLRAGDAAWIEALYWRGRLAGDGEDAERDLRRVALEYSTSPWADDALLQLSQLALAAANPASALDLASRLRSDYPGSDLRPRAALWGARAAFEVGETWTACTLLDTARTEGAADVEFLNQVAFYRARCTTRVTAPPSHSTPTGAPVAGRPDPAPRPAVDTAAAVPPDTARRASAASSWEVQVASVQNEAAARDLIRRLGDLGRNARIARADDRYRVRLGPYPSHEAAEAASTTVRRRVGGEPFVVRAP